MASVADYFPYQSFRKNQKEMLEAAAKTARDGGILMIDAPTGSGKSSVIASLLAEANGKKIFVAVRTISQLQIFIRELELIRQKKKKDLKFVYLIGKGNMCPLGGYGDVYRRCQGVKAFSTALMHERADRGSMIPAKDKMILEQIRRQDRDHPMLCPYFISSRVFVQSEDGGRRMIPSQEMRTKSEQAQKGVVMPGDLHEFAGNVCPYDLMLSAARGADVVILNYHHLFSDDIREQLYVTLQCEPADVMLLLDEAHNLGDIVQGIQSIRLSENDIESASYELASTRGKVRGADAVRHVLPRIAEFMNGLKRSNEAEDWFDPAIFNRLLIKGSLYEKFDGILDDLLSIKETLREASIQKADYRETAIERLCEFLFRIYRSSSNPAFLTIYVKDGELVILEVRNIDPANRLQEMVTMHAATVLISGTLAPVEAYRSYYFGELPVATLSLPNSFPKENRLILASHDITTAFSRRQNTVNTQAIVTYILAFAKLPGNVAIYFPSYQLQSQFAKLCDGKIRTKQVFIEPRETEEANAALKEFVLLPAKRKSGIMFAVCGGKWSEGLDYRGDQLTAAMVIGLPLAPFTRVRRMVNSYFCRKFGDNGEFIAYTLPAMNKAMQALGRVLRTETDRGVLILGEERFLAPEIFSGLPPWMKAELRECDADTLAGILAKWK
ncbi:MAG: ATP-dependent DNA helicase [Methanocalculaceae archaeon]|jgi:DNA excision repair protein ERCC-2|nr:ATP-dependent DNA helicase [Methanocalculaceae archaeon]